MIYICIPALNEAPTVGVLVWKLRSVMSEFGRDYHVLVLDDGSTDDTQDVLDPYMRVLPLTVLRNERTTGYAAAVERLLREAVSRSTHPRRDAVVVLQGDFTDAPEDVPALVRRLEGGADVVGASAAPRADEPRSHRWLRRGLSWLLAGRAVPREISDPASGFRAYRVAVLKRMLAERNGGPVLDGTGWAANVRLLLEVAPHARRSDSAEIAPRSLQRPRPSRMQPWTTAKDLWRVARSAPRRSAAGAPVIQPEPEAQPEPAATAAPAPRRRGSTRRRSPRKTQQGEST